MSKTSIIVCTYNRCESLKDTLEALKNQTLSPAQGLEILVIDNNSRDQTKMFVEQAARSSPYPIRYIFENHQGKSFALNRGIQEAQGDLLLFTDDDVIPRQNWAQTLIHAFEVYQADCVGGKVLPLWSGTPPDWLINPLLKRNVAGILAMLDYGDCLRVADPADENFLYGCNIAFRKSVFDELGLYRLDLGPRGGELSRGEDTEMMRRFLQAGKKAVYVPEAVVHHKVEKERMTMKYFRRRRFDGGKSDYYRLPREKKRIPLWFVRESAANGAKAFLLYLRGDKINAINKELLFWAKMGRIAGALGL